MLSAPLAGEYPAPDDPHPVTPRQGAGRFCCAVLIASRASGGYSWAMPDDTRTTATAYGPDRPSPDGYRNPTDAEVTVLSSLDVDDDEPVEVRIEAGRGDWADKAGQTVTVRRVQLQYIRRPSCDPRAVIATKLAMSSLASRMHPDFGGPLRRSDPVAYWDMCASMDDRRAALCLASGIPVENISRDGYDLSKPSARRFHADRCASYGAKL